MPPVILDITPEEYEDGVAELLAHKFEGRGVVERDVRLQSRSGGSDRQVDILVRLAVPDMDDVLIVVDCKRYGSRVDMKDVEMFVGLVEDVGAPVGLLVTTEGFTRGATLRAASARGIRVEVVRVDELPGWEPPLVACELCAEARHPDAFPGMAYIDQEEEIETENGEFMSVTLGYCELCGALHMQCPQCEVVNIAGEWRTDEWLECESGCGLEWYLRREMTKDDLSDPAHSRLTLRPSR